MDCGVVGETCRTHLLELLVHEELQIIVSEEKGLVVEVVFGQFFDEVCKELNHLFLERKDFGAATFEDLIFNQNQHVANDAQKLNWGLAKLFDEDHVLEDYLLVLQVAFPVQLQFLEESLVFEHKGNNVFRGGALLQVEFLEEELSNQVDLG